MQSKKEKLVNKQKLLKCTVSKIYTPIFPFFQKRVVNIMISDLRPVSNKSPGNSTFYRGIHKFLNPSTVWESKNDPSYFFEYFVRY